VVDDDKNIRNTLTAILEDEGYIVDLADCGNEALRKAESGLYNVALLDIRLPDMEGTELLRKLRNTVPKMRKIMVTGFPTLKNAIVALNRGADAYIVKPIDVNRLLNVVRYQLKMQEDEKKFSEQKIAEFLDSRAREIENQEIR
jgi:DNA-binding response OmpR family regulator